MPDPKFFPKPEALTLDTIAQLSGAQLAPGADPRRRIAGVAPLDAAGAEDLGFLDNVKYTDAFLKTRAGACFVRPERAGGAPAGMALLLTSQPYKAYALAAQALYPDARPEGFISPQAVIAPSAKIGRDVRIEHGAIIGPGVTIGDESWIEAYTIIGTGVQIGQSCRIQSHVVISHAIIGDHVRLYPGVRIGQDGFGFAIDPAGHVKVPQLGRVIIGNHVEVGANSCIDRGAGPDTVIGDGTWIDNLVQIGHNVKIGRGCIIVAQVGIAGSTVLEDFVALGGQAGIAGHLHIGKGARIAAQSGVIRDVPAGEEQMGYPALPMKQFMRHVATLNRLIKREKSS